MIMMNYDERRIMGEEILNYSEIKEKQRCAWVTEDRLYQEYHDREWGVPLHDDRRLFEMLILEGMQAGLSWLTVLRKREAFRQALEINPTLVEAWKGKGDSQKALGRARDASLSFHVAEKLG